MSAPALTRVEPGALLPTVGGATFHVRAARGEGSYARVYEGVLQPGTRHGALKLPKVEIPEAISWLESEREFLRGVSHPQLVHLIDAGESQGTPFVVLEWLEGPTLREEIARRRRLPLRQSLEIVEALAEVLVYLHARGLAHGDLRVENVILVPVRGAILTDPAPQHRTGNTGPEASDLRALGELLHRCVTGREPDDATPRLTTAAGFNRKVVQLWDATRTPAPLPAARLLEQLRALRQGL